MQGKIINITRFCTEDGPGIRTTVFLKGCPLRCIWCHNPESQQPDEEQYVISGETIGRTVSAAEVFDEIQRDRGFYETSDGGVTISGGEPLFQPHFTVELLRLCREAGIHTAIETCGYATEQVFEEVTGYCNLVLFDIKETQEKRHLEYTGVSLAPILSNLKRLDEREIPFLLRLPIVPGLNDREEHFLRVRELVGGLSHCRGTEIMPYHKLGEYKYRQLGREYLCRQIVEPSAEQVNEWKKLSEADKIQ